MPSLEELDKKGKERRSKQDTANQELEVPQAFKYGQRSIEEKVRLENLEKRVLLLAENLSLNVGNPPGDGARKQDSSTPNGSLSLSRTLP